MKISKRIFSLILALVIAISFGFCVSAQADNKQATVLFTHDLHSHLLPSNEDDGGQFGGYARLMTAIKEQKAQYPDAILVDGGDFAMGSLFQTAFATSAIELRMMGAMGYDATTLGNHEFDYLPTGLSGMLNAAATCGEPVPAIVNANYLPPKEGDSGYTEDSTAVWAAFKNYGVKDYTIIERGGIHYVLFGIFGYNADDCAPNSGMVMEDPVQAAQRTVDAAVAECKSTYHADPVVICLSHSGTEDGKGEDYTLAEAVKGIHLIISGHTHTTLEEPIEVNGTYIVSAAEYGKNLGVVQLAYTGSRVTLTDYKLIPIDETVQEDKDIASLVETFKTDVEENYLSVYGMSFDQVLTSNPYTFDTVGQIYGSVHESTLGNLYSDAYKWAVEEATGEPVDIALTASGVIRESMPLGNITVSDVFNAASLGVGTEGELVSVYITGADLKNALEVDATLSDLMSSARLYYAGIEYRLNTNRMLLNKVDYAMLRRDNGILEALEDTKLYRVVCGMYMAQMLGNVEEMSFGLITITPRTADGTPIAVKDLKNYVVKDENGLALKEWYAISSYLDAMGDTMDPQYGQTDGRKVVYSSLNPVDLLRNANTYTFVLLGVLLLFVLLIALITRSILRRIRQNKTNSSKE